ncbi:hypothetical protein N7449_005034 [Penicillium cf. viridicatum]|uniref:Uncharacterized protein n=1 Tax=Penicillium cf. viridicatum TaxID=2972119 RepID=A0A9W9SYY1_9EURO|nr:hypothetical protein N7449_005034 [Penicillium cf. viridicatum]
MFSEFAQLHSRRENPQTKSISYEEASGDYFKEIVPGYPEMTLLVCVAARFWQKANSGKAGRGRRIVSSTGNTEMNLNRPVPDDCLPRFPGT